MKKSFLSLLVLIVITVNVQAQVTNNPEPMATTPQTQPENNYWYYPEQNIYYNESSKSYWYYDKSTTKWASGTELSDPYKAVTDKDQKYQVSGKDIWKSNAAHKNKYKVQKNGMQKNKMKPSGN